MEGGWVRGPSELVDSVLSFYHALSLLTRCPGGETGVQLNNPVKWWKGWTESTFLQGSHLSLQPAGFAEVGRGLFAPPGDLLPIPRAVFG